MELPHQDRLALTPRFHSVMVLILQVSWVVIRRSMVLSSELAPTLSKKCWGTWFSIPWPSRRCLITISIILASISSKKSSQILLLRRWVARILSFVRSASGHCRRLNWRAASSSTRIKTGSCRSTLPSSHSKSKQTRNRRRSDFLISQSSKRINQA